MSEQNLHAAMSLATLRIATNCATALLQANILQPSTRTYLANVMRDLAKTIALAQIFERHQG